MTGLSNALNSVAELERFVLENKMVVGASSDRKSICIHGHLFDD